jgi:hypothetical protein
MIIIIKSHHYYHPCIIIVNHTHIITIILVQIEYPIIVQYFGLLHYILNSVLDNSKILLLIASSETIIAIY